MHLCPGNWVAIVRAVVYNAQAAHTFMQELKVGTFSLENNFRIKHTSMKHK